jgi:hypothetical protein
MSVQYLAEYAEKAQLSLKVAKKEATHLAYTQNTLFAQQIDLAWISDLEFDEEKSEKIDAFVSRFGRLQDFLGEKLIPVFANLLSETPKSMLDVLSFAEKMEWLEDAEAFISARKLRNLLVHEYMEDPTIFLDALFSAHKASKLLLTLVSNLENQAKTLNLSK